MGGIIDPSSTMHPCMKPSGLSCKGVGSVEEGGSQTNWSHALLESWQVATLSRYEMTCARAPSSLCCGTCVRGLIQQLMAFSGVISTTVVPMNASTRNKTFRRKILSLGIQHLPTAASPTCWRVQALSLHPMLDIPPTAFIILI